MPDESSQSILTNPTPVHPHASTLQEAMEQAAHAGACRALS